MSPDLQPALVASPPPNYHAQSPTRETMKLLPLVPLLAQRFLCRELQSAKLASTSGTPSAALPRSSGSCATNCA